MSKFFGKFSDYDDEEMNFQPKRKKRDQQKIVRKKSKFDDYDYLTSYDEYQKPARKKARQFG